jgi:hypothetical protein
MSARAGVRVRMAALILGSVLVGTTGCGMEVGAGYPETRYEGYPPDAYIAPTEPYYYEGRASYWYGGHWYYRDGGRWGSCAHVPRGLYDRRMQGPQRRRSYEPPSGGQSMGRGGARGGAGIADLGFPEQRLMRCTIARARGSKGAYHEPTSAKDRHAGNQS